MLHVHADGRAAARVTVNGRALLPSCESQPIERALAYVEAVLVDCRAEDRLFARAQGVGMLRNLQPADGEAACAWLRARADEAAAALAGQPSALQPASGKRAIVREGAEEDSTSLKKSLS